ncbi:hypothetical protein [Methylobacter sp. S3L5C]|nr:hypothetical protein [Methylobacter sp. S3L5C]UOA08461.1 hypothetical protein KKZ03_20075 [Methylobacter sp. S3L5C]
MQPETVDDEAAALLMTVLELNIYQRKYDLPDYTLDRRSRFMDRTAADQI